MATHLCVGLAFLASTVVLQFSSPPGSDSDYIQRLTAAFNPYNFKENAARIESLTWDFQWLQFAFDASIFFYSLSRGKVKRTVGAWGQFLDTVLGICHIILFTSLYEEEKAAHASRPLLKYIELLVFGLQEATKTARIVPSLNVYWALAAIDLAGTALSGAIHAVRVSLPTAEEELAASGAEAPSA